MQKPSQSDAAPRNTQGPAPCRLPSQSPPGVPIATDSAVRHDGSSPNAAAKTSMSVPVQEFLQGHQPSQKGNPKGGLIVLPGEPQPPTPPLGKEDWWEAVPPEVFEEWKRERRRLDIRDGKIPPGDLGIPPAVPRSAGSGEDRRQCSLC